MLGKDGCGTAATLIVHSPGSPLPKPASGRENQPVIMAPKVGSPPVTVPSVWGPRPGVQEDRSEEQALPFNGHMNCFASCPCSVLTPLLMSLSKAEQDCVGKITGKKMLAFQPQE